MFSGMMFPSECELEVERSANARGPEKAAAGRASARPGKPPTGGAGHPSSHAASTSRISASKAATSRRGMVLPLTYWLTWLFPSFLPRVSASRIRSACLRPRASIERLSRSENTSSMVAPIMWKRGPRLTLANRAPVSSDYIELYAYKFNMFNIQNIAILNLAAGTPIIGR